MDPRADAPSIATSFTVDGQVTDVAAHAGGHIHDSFVVTTSTGQHQCRYLLQRINTEIFRDPIALMQNVERITAHVAKTLVSMGVRDAARRGLTLVATRDGPSFRQREGETWRMYHFVDRTKVYQSPKTPEHAYQAAYAFGAFQVLLAGMPSTPLHETIPDFHNTVLRFKHLAAAIAADARQRVKIAQREIETAQEYKETGAQLHRLLAAGDLQLRATHNDAKISNVLFDQRSDQALCVVDLDTVMPGLAPHDFGDMIRSMATTAEEDETDLSKVQVDLNLAEGLIRGYVESTRPLLTKCERSHLVLAGKTITLEQGVRFLTDFLCGDTYYKTTRAMHNLDRCRNQFKLLRSIEKNEAQLIRMVEKN